MERLTMDHILSLIDSEDYVVTKQYIQCILMVGEAPIIGTSYCFNTKNVDVPRGKESARKDAIDKLFDYEAYHQKRLRKVGMGKAYAESTEHDAKVVDLNLGNPFKDMAERDVTLSFAGIDCQAALKEYADNQPLTAVEETQALAKSIKRHESILVATPGTFPEPVVDTSTRVDKNDPSVFTETSFEKGANGIQETTKVYGPVSVGDDDQAILFEQHNKTL